MRWEKNYSATQTALEYAVKHTGIAIKFDYFSLELRLLRSKVCHIDSNPRCYFYIMQDIAYMCYCTNPSFLLTSAHYCIII